MRICLFGGPGIGKSTLAHRLVVNLKEMHLSVEYVDEWIKAWAYEKKIPKGWDQFHVFGQQVYKESFLMQNGVQHIVTDSPITMQYAYMKRDKVPYAEQCKELAKCFETEFPSINVRLLRTFDYQQQGRYENVEQAIAVDDMIKDVMDECLNDYLEYSPVDHKLLLDDILVRSKCCR